LGGIFSREDRIDTTFSADVADGIDDHRTSDVNASDMSGSESPMANLMLSVLGAVALFERDLIRECQREGIALAKQRGAYTGRKKARPASYRAGRLCALTLPYLDLIENNLSIFSVCFGYSSFPQRIRAGLVKRACD
jgi:hypothetical protein